MAALKIINFKDRKCSKLILTLMLLILVDNQPNLMTNEQTIEDLKQQLERLKQDQKHLLKLVSHDVKSPFNKLFALSNLLQLTADNLSEEQQDYLLRMDWVIKEGLTVVRNLLDLRAIDSGKIELHEEPIELSRLVKESINGYQKQIGVKKLKISELVNEVTIQSDRRHLERIIDHLLSNAIKFSPLESDINLSLTTPSNTTQFTVSTQSGPIPEEEVGNLFQKHSPLSTRPSHGENALGNGLFIAKTYAQLLGGTIEFVQEENKVEFVLTLPTSLPKT